MDRNEMFIVERTEFSEICLSLIDMMCDIARLSGNVLFKDIALIDMCNHLVNFYFQNFPEQISIDYLNSHTNIDGSVFEKIIGQPITKENFIVYSSFRRHYVLAILNELAQTDIVKLNVKNEGKSQHTYYKLKEHMLARKLTIEDEDGYQKDIDKFGMKLLSKDTYINGQIQILEVKNNSFIMQIDNLKAELGIGLLVYIALGNMYEPNPDKIIHTVLSYIEDNIKVIEDLQKEGNDAINISVES